MAIVGFDVGNSNYCLCVCADLGLVYLMNQPKWCYSSIVADRWRFSAPIYAAMVAIVIGKRVVEQKV
jgi:hypothetical protein